MASPSSHFLLLLLPLVLLTARVSADEQDFQLQALSYPPPRAPIVYNPPTSPVKPYTPPPATKPPSPPAKPYTPPSFTKPTTPPAKPYTPPPFTKPTTPPATPYTPPPVTKPPTPPAQPYTPPPVIKPPSPPAKSYTPPPSAPAPPVPTPTPYRPPVKKEDCVPLCEGRCKLHSRKRLCVRACSTCCVRCKCVPPGTYGNREVCGKCYTDMLTHGGRVKCP